MATLKMEYSKTALEVVNVASSTRKILHRAELMQFSNILTVLGDRERLPKLHT